MREGAKKRRESYKVIWMGGDGRLEQTLCLSLSLCAPHPPSSRKEGNVLAGAHTTDGGEQNGVPRVLCLQYEFWAENATFGLLPVFELVVRKMDLITLLDACRCLVSNSIRAAVSHFDKCS